MSREEAIQKVAASIEPNACIVSTTGMISRELFEARTAWNQGHERDFLTVGSMGHASQIALGIALQSLIVEFIALMVMVQALCIWVIWLLLPA